jgi:hypothetical protein
MIVENQPRCPPMGEWIKKIWCLHTMEYYLATKNEVTSFAERWLELQIVMLTEISNPMRKVSHFLSFVKLKEKRRK